MNRKKLLVKTVVTLTLFFLFFTILTPLSTAGPMDDWYRCEPEILITWDEEDVNEPISPYSAPVLIPIKINIKIRGALQHIVTPRYVVHEFITEIYMDEAPEWCKVTLDPPLLMIPVNQEWESGNATISLTLDKDSPAFETSKIKIRVTTRSLGGGATVVSAGNKTLEIPFTVGYVPLLAINELEGNYKVINPDETANFPIEIINLGNGKTDIKTDILSIPEGWQVETISELSLGVKYLGDNYKKTLNLAIKPPYDFGYHEDREVIKISVTPYSNKYSNMSGESHALSFVVHSKGFSTPGFEGILLVFSVIVILSIMKKHRMRDNKRNHSSKRGDD